MQKFKDEFLIYSNPCTCGFAKILAYNIFNTKLKVQDTGTTKLEHQFQLWCGTFNDNFKVDIEQFKQFNAIVKNIQSLGKTRPKVKKDLCSFFGQEAFDKLANKDKCAHKLFDCTGCLQSVLYKSKLASFQVNSKNSNFVLKSKENRLNEMKEVLETTQEIITNFNEDYQKKYNTSFTEVAQSLGHTVLLE